MNPPRKKIRLDGENFKEFAKGAIMSIYLENFVTYKKSYFSLSPSLNMIIGPNGSGKSTFVCAVCLGLGGSPEFIGRSKRLDDFIKNGEEKSTIELVLRNNEEASKIRGDTIKITTVILKGKRNPTFSINNREITLNRMKEIMASFHVQLGNLCQFLSQERVEEFARLKPEKLLEQTISSVRPDLLGFLKELKELQENEETLKTEIDVKSKRAEELNAKKQELNQAIQALEEYTNIKQKIKHHKQLLPYVHIKDHKLKLQQYKDDYKKAKDQIRQFLKDKQPITTLKSELDQKTQQKDLEKQQLSSEFEICNNNLTKIFQNLNKNREAILSKKTKNRYYRERTENLKKSIEDTERNYEVQTSALSQLQVPTNEEFNEVAEERNRMIEKEDALHRARRDTANQIRSFENELRTIAQTLDQKKVYLTGKDKISMLDSNPKVPLHNVKRAILHLRESNDEEMQKSILPPPIMAVSVKDQRLASYLGACVDFNTAKALTIVSNDAFDRYGPSLLDNFGINTRVLSETRFSPPLTIKELNEYGFDNYLINYVEGDKNVKNMLCQFAKIHSIPVTTRTLTNEQLERIKTPKDGKILFKKFIHGDYIVRVNQSKYGNRAVNLAFNKIKPSDFYRASGLSDDAKKQVNQEIVTLKQRQKTVEEELETLQNQKIEINTDLKAVTTEQENISEKSKHLDSLKREYFNKKAVIDVLKGKLQDLKDENKRDVSEMIKRTTAEINDLIGQQPELLKSISAQMKNMKELQKQLFSSELEWLDAFNSSITMNDVVSTFDEREKELQREYQEKKQLAKSMRETEGYKTWIAQIKEYTPEVKEQLNTYAEQYRNEDKFDLDTIKGIISELESQIALANNDESAVPILRRTEKELAALNETLPENKRVLEAAVSKMEEIRAAVEPELDDMVSRISETFTDLFKSVGSAGEVKLEKPHSFAQWKIVIMVKFRDNARLKKLDSQTQSGGERAVSTITYMIALQDFTTAPFRVVDEINQGMDQRNERIIHKAMVENACKANTSQYFLITPKLLTNLYYHEKMRVHCVMAGPWIPDPTEKPEMIHFGETSKYIF